MYCSQRCTKRWGKCPLLTPVLRNYTLVVHTPTSHISPPAVAAPRDLLAHTLRAGRPPARPSRAFAGRSLLGRCRLPCEKWRDETGEGRHARACRPEYLFRADSGSAVCRPPTVFAAGPARAEAGPPAPRLPLTLPPPLPPVYVESRWLRHCRASRPAGAPTRRCVEPRCYKD